TTHQQNEIPSGFRARNPSSLAVFLWLTSSISVSYANMFDHHAANDATLGSTGLVSWPDAFREHVNNSTASAKATAKKYRSWNKCGLLGSGCNGGSFMRLGHTF